jgi:N-acetylglucosaminyldiphosphoundecaprenol N-acetyl-beta-D-mannosaminyltransferase
MSNSEHPGVLLDIPISARQIDELMSDVQKAVAGEGAQIVFACANTHAVAVAQSDAEFMRALRDAEHVVADGVGLTIMAKLARVHVGPRIVGEQYFRAVMSELARLGGKKVFFFGSSQKVLDLIRMEMAVRYPAVQLAGVLSPPFRPWTEEENAQMIDQINEARPDVLWVGMTAPKQELWTYRNRRHLEVPVIGSVGAVFEFFAGTVPSPPDWVRRLGVETFYRYWKDPKPLRFWRRDLISGPVFVSLVIRRHVLRPRRPPSSP